MTEEVRLKGFGRRAALGRVLEWIRDTVTPLGLERVPFRESLGRVLANDIRSTRDVPSFRRSAMDGYAVRTADLPGSLTVVGDLTAAEIADRPLAAEQAFRVMTGARIPDGADAVVMIEKTRVQGERIIIDDPSPVGKHILRVGEDIAVDQTVLARGRRLRPADIAMLVQAGVLEAVVRRRPRVLILPTGTELRETGRQATGSAVVESNSFMLAGLAERDGAQPILHPIVGDDPTLIRALMADAGADVIVVTGGSSVGKEDFAPVVANELGEVAFHGIALKPGSTTGLGRIGDTWVVLGPGYPVAAHVAWDLVARPLIAALLGTDARWPYRTETKKMAEPYPKREGRTEVVRVLVDPDGAHVRVLPGGSAILSTLTEAYGFLCLPDEQGALQPGDPVVVNLFD